MELIKFSISPYIFKFKMNRAVEKFFISSSAVDSFIFISPIEYAVQHFSYFAHSYMPQLGKNIRVCYLVLFNSFESFKLVQNKLHSLQKSFLYNVSMIGFHSRQEINQHIKMMQKMNENQFESQYIQMLDLLQKQIQIGIIKELCEQELRWSQAKINNLIEREGIKSIRAFLNYRGFNQLEVIKINQICTFLDKYSNKRGDN